MRRFVEFSCGEKDFESSRGGTEQIVRQNRVDAGVLELRLMAAQSLPFSPLERLIESKPCRACAMKERWGAMVPGPKEIGGKFCRAGCRDLLSCAPAGFVVGMKVPMPRGNQMRALGNERM